MSSVRRTLASWPQPLQWGVLLLLSILLSLLWGSMRLPAWPLLGPMLLLAVLHAGGWLSIDLPFVLALQAVRLLFVIGLAPLVTRLVVRHSPHLQTSPG
jgi:uncharacterized protein